MPLTVTVRCRRTSTVGSAPALPRCRAEAKKSERAPELASATVTEHSAPSCTANTLTARRSSTYTPWAPAPDQWPATSAPMSPLRALSAVTLPFTLVLRSCSQGWRGLFSEFLTDTGCPHLLGHECASGLDSEVLGEPSSCWVDRSNHDRSPQFGEGLMTLRGKRPPRATLVDVALAAQVSRQTVSNVLNNPRRVAPETRARVQSEIERLSFRPNLAA